MFRKVELILLLEKLLIIFLNQILLNHQDWIYKIFIRIGSKTSILFSVQNIYPTVIANNHPFSNYNYISATIHYKQMF